MIQKLMCLVGKHDFYHGLSDVRSCKRLECPRLEVLQGNKWIPAPRMGYNARLGGLN